MDSRVCVCEWGPYQRDRNHLSTERVVLLFEYVTVRYWTTSFRSGHTRSLRLVLKSFPLSMLLVPATGKCNRSHGEGCPVLEI